jgi:hypothetical protein
MSVKNNLYCINCGLSTHLYKNCNKGIISNGIICFHIDNCKKKFINVFHNNFNINIDIENVNYNNENIKFLLIQRNSSLGFLEFMRGHYDETDINTINNLTKQMNNEEITNIINNDFDVLWEKLWNCKGVGNMKYYNEYINSKKKFDFIKLNYDCNIFSKSEYDFNEWGIPKGRRNRYENNINCAMRELMEETGLTLQDYYIFKKIPEITENLIGTNGKKYDHNYLLALVYENKHYDFKNYEVGDVKMCNIQECFQLIRPYHTEKIKILKIVYANIINILEHYDSL